MEIKFLIVVVALLYLCAIIFYVIHKENKIHKNKTPFKDKK
jgi:hypothetical protein